MALLLTMTALSAPAIDSVTARDVTGRDVTVQIAPSETPRVSTVECLPGEQLVGGGYETAARELRVISSFPSSRREWSVTSWNLGKVAAPLRIHAVCVAGGGEVILQAATGPTAVCPAGTVRTGGGHKVDWSPRGSPLVIGSHPTADNGWIVAVQQPPTDAGAAPAAAGVTTYALCLGGGAQVRIADPVSLSVPPGAPDCTTTPTTVVVCNYPRSATQTATCAQGDLVAIGFQLVAGNLPSYSVLASGSRFTVNGVSRDNTPLELRLTAVCLSAATVEPDRTNLSWPILGGAGLLVLLLLLGLLTVLRLRSRSAAGAANIDVVLRSQQSSFRFDRFREIP